MATKQDIDGIVSAIRALEEGLLENVVPNREPGDPLFEVDQALNSLAKHLIEVQGLQRADQAAMHANNLRLEEMTQNLSGSHRSLQRTQSELVQAAKMSALGELGAGIAHELNQPLTVITGLLGLTLDDQGVLPEDTARDLATALTEAERMVAIINNIKTFARETEHAQAPVNLAEVIDHAVNLVGEQLKHNDIWLEKGEFNVEAMVHGDAMVLQQVVINLVINAKDALLESEERPHKKMRLSLLGDSESVIFRIEDNGPGIPEKIRKHIFNPFFTTKPVGVGTGLGLSISHGIVEKHGGTIGYVDSALGGAGFEVTIARYEPQGTELAAALPARTETQESITIDLQVLVVDDDALVRVVVKSILAKMGCTVSTAASGAEACRYLGSHAVDLVVTDFMMPEMNGYELILAMRRQCFAVPVVVLTGGRTERIVRLAEDAGALECVEKPINRRKMQKILEQVQRKVKR